MLDARAKLQAALGEAELVDVAQDAMGQRWATTRKLQRGDIHLLNGFPMTSGNCTAAIFLRVPCHKPARGKIGDSRVHRRSA